MIPYDIRQKIELTKNLIANPSQVTYFGIVNTYKNNPIIPQQIPSQIQPGIHHVQPLGMKPSIGIRIAACPLAFFSGLLGVFQISL
jgi:hypothetical protein